MKAMRIAAVLLSVCALAACAQADDFLFAHFPFDGDLQDASGKGHHAAGQAQFAEGKVGRALKLNWEQVQVPDSPDLRLAPGLTIDCWVYFDEKPTGYQPIVIKGNEYQLRLDDQREGGRFSFFVYLDGWEPRVSTTVPVAGKWYHLTAKWTGTEISLTVNDERVSSERFGTPQPTDNPLVIGKANCRIDELKLRNPSLEKTRQMLQMIQGAGDVGRVTSRGSSPAARGRAGAERLARRCHNATAHWPPNLPTRTRCC